MISENLRTIMKSRNLTLNQLAEMADVPLETVRNIYYGKVTDPKASTLLALSRVFHVSMNYLMGEKIHTKEEERLLKYYNKCGKHGQSVLMLTAYYEADRTKRERALEGEFTVPCVVPLGPVRDGVDYNTSRTEEIVTSNPDAYIAIEFTSNSFAPIFCKGDKVLVSERMPENGEAGIFIKDGIAYCRIFVERDEEYILKSLNGKGESFKLKRMDEVRCVGTCIDIMRA